MLIFILLMLLILSFAIHIFTLVQYVLNRSKGLFNAFFGTAILNIIVGMLLSIAALRDPTAVRGLDIAFVLWIISGVVMSITFLIQISLGWRIFRRAKNPDFYHYNFFGKKVFNERLIKNHEYMIFFLTIPFFLLIGAYFVARLINLFIYGHI